MAVTKVNPFLGKLAARIHTGLYKMSGGRMGGRLGKADALILGTVGRKSGLRRETPLFYVEHDRPGDPGAGTDPRYLTTRRS